MNEIAAAVKELIEVFKIWMSGSEGRRIRALRKAIEELFDLLEKDNITEKLFNHYKKKIRAYL